MEHTNGMGADRGAECVGYQAHDPRGHEDNSATLNNLVSSVRFTGGIGTVGVYVPQDPGGPNELAKHGKAPLDVGSFWFKGQHMGTGQCPVKRYNRYLRSLIAETRSSRPGSFPTTCLSTRHPRLTSTSMPGKKAGRRSSFTQDRRPDQAIRWYCSCSSTSSLTADRPRRHRFGDALYRQCARRTA